jgi:signal transduction histidine kinase
LPSQPGTGHGLVNLRSRADELGGRFDTLDRPGGGTIVRWQAPILD